MLKDPVSTGFNTYQPGKIIGQGGSGVVYEARNSEGELFALKCLRPGLSGSKRKRFEHEIRFCQNCEHPNIVSVLGTGPANVNGEVVPFYVMPFYDKTLRVLLTEGIPAAKVLPLFLQLLDGVEAAHLLRVYHRDLKPENVLYDGKSGRLKVADFGAAAFTEEELFTLVATKPGERIANFQYASPEQRKPGTPVDQRADIYALALMLNEMYTGDVPTGTRHPLIGEKFAEYAFLDDLVEWMRSQSPDDRPPTIAEIKRQIISRSAEHVEFQKLNSLKTKVISSTVPDLPPPIQVENVEDYKGGDIVFRLDRQPPGSWIEAFKNPGNYRSLVGRGPESVRFVSNTAIMQTGPNEIEATVHAFKACVNAANLALPDRLTEKARQQDASERERARREVTDQEARLNALRRANSALG